MKILTPEELQGHNNAVVKGGAKGFFGGLAVAIPVSLIAERRWSYYRSLPISIKALGMVTIVVPAFVVAAEQAGHEYERAQWKGFGKDELDEAQTAEQQRWDTLDTKTKVTEWASQNKWGIILGSWATSMAGSFGIIMRDRYQTFPQKIVQARMWAQGLTVGVVLVSAVLSAHARKRSNAHQSAVDHSWTNAVAIEMRRTKEQEAQRLS